MGGLGKTTLVRDVYQSEQLNVKFRCRACVTIMHPFDCGELIKSLARQLDAEDYENKEETGLTGGRTKPRVQRSLADILEGKKYLIVLDDLSSATEWDSIIQHLPARETASRIIVTTRSENIARHCSKKHENIYKLQILGYEDGLNLFTEKVPATLPSCIHDIFVLDKFMSIPLLCCGIMSISLPFAIYKNATDLFVYVLPFATIIVRPTKFDWID
jgi:hypothetical protein